MGQLSLVALCLFWMERIIISFICLLALGCEAQEGKRAADPNGINKWYMGRQIAQVMGHMGIGWLERPEREQEERVSLLLENLSLKPGEQVADIGAGSGYHSLRMAARISPGGRVLAVDIQPEMLAFIRQQAVEAGLNNVQTILGLPKSVNLPAESVDKMLLVDVYHEFEFPYEMGLSMKKALKPCGLLYLVEYRGEDPEVPIKTIHKMTEAQARAEMEAAGFRFVRNLTNLPWQHCLVFEKPI
jgi:SAM-dependent methyltransferase